MRLLLLFATACLLSTALSAQEPAERPRLGLTLSGGGAKGLAHIGILKAIDSAGLKIDYVTGTSMGGIMGGLYAVGYSGDSIEKIARAIDWEQLLTNRTALRALIMEEKDEYGRYAVELPLVKGEFQLPSGVLEGEELWLLLNGLFLPAYRTNDFSQLSIPFQCVATEVATGEAMVISGGSLTTAIRASMAIPTVFTAVDVDGCRLVDGGLVRNFPVSDVKAMGADYIIGSSVSSGLLPQEKLTNAPQILMQIVFFQEALDEPRQVALCDIYVKHPIENYSAGSFGKSAELIDLGIQQGRLLYPQLKRLADSLDAHYGSQERVANRLPAVDSIRITGCEVFGLEYTDYAFFTNKMGFQPGAYYRPAQLTAMVRQVFGTRYYSRVVYELLPQDDGSARIVFHVAENARTFAKLGIHYNGFSGASVIANLTTRNFFLRNSRSFVALNLSEDFRARAEHMQYVGHHKNRALIGALYFESFGFTTYDAFRQDGLFRQSFFKAEVKLQASSRQRFALGLGYRYESVRYKPTITSRFDLQGRNRLNSGLAYCAWNTLDRSTFPSRGVKLDGELAYIFRQNPSVTFLSEGEPIEDLDSLGVRFNDYGRVFLYLETYSPLRRHLVLFTQTQAGANFNYRDNLLNDFYLGGLTRLHRNQVTFAGLPEGSLYTSSLLALQVGLRRELFDNLFLSLRSNAMVYDFLYGDNQLRRPLLLSGHALTLGYNFALGPLEISLMYSDQAKKFGTYINLGFAF